MPLPVPAPFRTLQTPQSLMLPAPALLSSQTYLMSRHQIPRSRQPQEPVQMLLMRPARRTQTRRLQVLQRAALRRVLHWQELVPQRLQTHRILLRQVLEMAQLPCRRN
jgi:hypothetical protein